MCVIKGHALKDATERNLYVIYTVVVKPALSDHVWAKKPWSLNTDGLLINVDMTKWSQVVSGYRWSQEQVSLQCKSCRDFTINIYCVRSVMIDSMQYWLHSQVHGGHSRGGAGGLNLEMTLLMHNHITICIKTGRRAEITAATYS